MMKNRIIFRTIFVCVLAFGFNFFSGSSASADDWLRQMAYEAAVQSAEEAGYKNYKIVVDDDYNVEIIVYDTSKTTPSKTTPPKTTLPPKKQKGNKDAAIKTERNRNSAEEKTKVESEYESGLRLLEEEKIVDAMKHFLKALPDERAEEKIKEIAYDYVDELMFDEKYQAARDFMIEHPFEGYEQLLAECNDHCFLVDLAKGLNARWKESNRDVSTWSDKKVREWYQKQVEYEMQYLDKYMKMGFSDSQLANYAFAYIGALQSQETGAAYFGIDNLKFEENWIVHGQKIKDRLVYLINRKYGIEINSAYQESFKDCVQAGEELDFLASLTESLTEQLSLADISFVNDSSANGKGVYMKPFTIQNMSGYSMEEGHITIEALFLDKEGTAVTTRILFDSTPPRDGEDFKWNRQGEIDFKKHFDSFCFNCRINYQTERDGVTTYKIYEFTVNPSKQISWDGKNIIINGDKTTESKDISVALEDTKLYWTEYKDYFVPCIEFGLRNVGEAEIKEATIECVFVEKEKNTEWSRKKYYVVSKSEAPLQSGRRRDVVAYSDNGYTKKTRKVPDIEVEIYFNGDLLGQMDVEKP